MKLRENLFVGVDDNILGALLNRFCLNEVEYKVAKLILEGLSNKRIGERLGLTEGTVKVYVSSIFTRTKIHTRAQFIVRFQSEFLMLRFFRDVHSILGIHWEHSNEVDDHESRIKTFVQDCRTRKHIIDAWPEVAKSVNLEPEQSLHLLSKLLEALKLN